LRRATRFAHGACALGAVCGLVAACGGRPGGEHGAGGTGGLARSAVHVDRVRDDACNPDREFIWQQTTGPTSQWGFGVLTASGGLLWEVTPATLRVFNQVGPCSLNGVFDLTISLPCPAGK
jgi:hypothetical protein